MSFIFYPLTWFLIISHSLLTLLHPGDVGNARRNTSPSGRTNSSAGTCNATAPHFIRQYFLIPSILFLSTLFTFLLSLYLLLSIYLSLVMSLFL